MRATTLPHNPACTINLDTTPNITSLIGLVDRILLDAGTPVYLVIAILQRARRAAGESNEAALQVLTEQGFRFVRHGRVVVL
jgi:hypothetical protein